MSNRIFTDRCPDGRVDCFAWGERGKCLACGDTRFIGDCPFYKTAEQRRAEHRASVERLEKMGRYDLIDFYGEDNGQRIIWRSI